MELDEEPLRRYSDCEDSSEIVDVQADYLAAEWTGVELVGIEY